MLWFVEHLLAFVDAIAIALILAFVFGAVRRAVPFTMLVRLLAGVVMGLGGWAVMLSPVEFLPGMMIDLRAAFVVLSAAFLGWQAGLVTLGFVIAGRLILLPMPPQGWSLLSFVFIGLAGQYLTALVWRGLRPRYKGRPLLLAALLVVLTQGAALLLTPWVTLLALPGFFNVLVVQYAVRGMGLFFTTLVMMREEELLRRDTRNQRLARIDPLTALLNRRGFFDAVAKEGLGKRYAVLCIDLDGFKAFNDRAGHGDGDRLLMALADVLRRTFPPNTMIARFGGDEFVVLLRQPHAGAAILLGQSVVDILEEVSPPGGDPFRQTVSVGHAEGTGEDDLKKVLHQADVAMYRAKRAGGGQLESDGPLPEAEPTVRSAIPA